MTCPMDNDLACELCRQVGFWSHITPILIQHFNQCVVLVIIESQSWKRPQGSLSPTPCHTGTPSNHSCLMAIWPLLKNLQRRRLHHTSRQPIPLPESSDHQEVLPEIQVESLFLSFETTAPCPSAWSHGKQTCPFLDMTSLQIFKHGYHVPFLTFF